MNVDGNEINLEEFNQKCIADYFYLIYTFFSLFKKGEKLVEVKSKITNLLIKNNNKNWKEILKEGQLKKNIIPDYIIQNAGGGTEKINQRISLPVPNLNNNTKMPKMPRMPLLPVPNLNNNTRMPKMPLLPDPNLNNNTKRPKMHLLPDLNLNNNISLYNTRILDNLEVRNPRRKISRRKLFGLNLSPLQINNNNNNNFLENDNLPLTLTAL